jgi:hypothetical protein
MKVKEMIEGERLRILSEAEQIKADAISKIEGLVMANVAPEFQFETIQKMRRELFRQFDMHSSRVNRQCDAAIKRFG